MGIFVIGQRNRLLLLGPVGGIGLERVKVAQRARVTACSAEDGLIDHGYPFLAYWRIAPTSNIFALITPSSVDVRAGRPRRKRVAWLRQWRASSGFTQRPRYCPADGLARSSSL